MLFTFREIFDIIAMTLIIGYIFKDVFKPKRTTYDPLKQQNNNSFWFAATAVGISIILHEFGHKFVAMALGLQATFHAAYSFLGFGLLMKMLNFGFIFFVPAYVSHNVTTPLNTALISIAGPATNLILYLICLIIIKKNLVPQKHLSLIYTMKYINGFLFIVNMLPLPGIDGYHFFTSIKALI
jgi:Zn-dependent protease